MIYILSGVSGSGKTTFAETLLQENINRVRLNRDDLRKTLFNVNQIDTSYYARKDIRRCENLVSEIIDQSMYDMLNKGLDIVLDNTHLKEKYITDIIRKFNHLSDINLIFTHDLSKETLNIFKTRLEDRYKGSDNIQEKISYVDRQWNQYRNLKQIFVEDNILFPQSNPQIIFDKSLPAVYGFDIDGTLALKGDRDIFDDSKLHLDTEIQEVGEVLRALYARGYGIIFLSGRQDSCKETTQKWLEDNGLWFDNAEIFMRAAKDQRCDSIVKEELLREYVVPKYNLVGIFDDRMRVNRTWYKLGVFCFNTNQDLVQF